MWIQAGFVPIVQCADATSIKEVVATREDDVWGNLGFLSKDAPPLKVLLRGLERKKQSIKCSRKPKNWSEGQLITVHYKGIYTATLLN